MSKQDFLPKKQTFKNIIKSAYWFAVGFILAGALLSSAVLFYFQYTYRNRSIPGIFIDNIYVGEKSKEEIEKIFNARNEKIGQSSIIFSVDGQEATASASTLKIGYDVHLISEQALTVGKTKSLLTDVYIILSSYVNGTFLQAPYTFDDKVLDDKLAALRKNIYKEPVNAEFRVENERVVAFRESSNGRDIDTESIRKQIKDAIPDLVRSEDAKLVRINPKIKVTKPKVSTEEANNLGIVEVIGTGHSTFYHSIPGRIHNVALAASKMNGILVAPGEEFSFDKTLGDVSTFTGYQQAYVIQNGKTVLGDGGGVCQVSTTLFRAVLNSGLPITERHPHAYRVGYYEQDAPPGFDATTFVPTVDFKFKNDTKNYILIQEYTDLDNLSLTFTLYGKSDGRQVSISQPVISNVSPAPPDLYQDDPTLPQGTVKQVDFAAPGGKSVFSRTVTKNGQVIISDTFVSVYKPWQAVFLRGTKT